MAGLKSTITKLGQATLSISTRLPSRAVSPAFAPGLSAQVLIIFSDEGEGGE